MLDPANRFAWNFIAGLTGRLSFSPGGKVPLRGQSESGDRARSSVTDETIAIYCAGNLEDIKAQFGPKVLVVSWFRCSKTYTLMPRRPELLTAYKYYSKSELMVRDCRTDASRPKCLPDIPSLFVSVYLRHDSAAIAPRLMFLCFSRKRVPQENEAALYSARLGPRMMAAAGCEI